MVRGYPHRQRRRALERVAERPASISDDEAAALWLFVGELAGGSELVQLLLATAARPARDTVEAAMVSRDVADDYASASLYGVGLIEQLEALVTALRIGTAVLAAAVETRADAKEVNAEASERLRVGALRALGIPMLEPQGTTP